MDHVIKQGNYVTKTEFIREAIREKMARINKDATFEWLRKIRGSSKRKTTDEELHRAGEQAMKELERELL